MLRFSVPRLYFPLIYYVVFGMLYTLTQFCTKCEETKFYAHTIGSADGLISKLIGADVKMHK